MPNNNNNIDTAFIKNVLQENVETLKNIPVEKRTIEQQILYNVLLAATTLLNDRVDIHKNLRNIETLLNEYNVFLKSFGEIDEDLESALLSIEKLSQWSISKDEVDTVHTKELENLRCELKKYVKTITNIEHRMGEQRIKNLEADVKKITTWTANKVGSYLSLFIPIIAALMIILGWWGNTNFVSINEFDSTTDELNSSMKSLIKEFHSYKFENQKDTQDILTTVKVLESKLKKE